MVLWVEFLLVFIFCIIMIASSFAFGRGSSRRRRAEAEAAVEAEMAAALARSQAEVAELRQRLEVLEKLAVDPEERLSDEIDRLKQDHRPPGAGPRT